jgi:hypothetical protein
MRTHREIIKQFGDETEIRCAKSSRTAGWSHERKEMTVKGKEKKKKEKSIERETK